MASGSASVTVGGVGKKMLGAGDHFGEIALIDEGPRAGEVVSGLRPGVCYADGGLWQFRPFVQDHPDVAWALLESLVQRIVRERALPGSGR